MDRESYLSLRNFYQETGKFSFDVFHSLGKLRFMRNIKICSKAKKVKKEYLMLKNGKNMRFLDFLFTLFILSPIASHKIKLTFVERE